MAPPMADLSLEVGAKNKHPPAGLSRFRKLGQLADTQICKVKSMFGKESNAACVLGRAQCVAWLRTAGELYKAFSDVSKLHQSASD